MGRRRRVVSVPGGSLSDASELVSSCRSRAPVAGIVAAGVTEDLQEPVLVLVLGIKVKGLDVDLPLLGLVLLLRELFRVSHEGLLQIPHDLLPDGLLHGEMSLEVFDVPLSDGPAVGEATLDFASPLQDLPVGRAVVEVLLRGTERNGRVGLLVGVRANRRDISRVEVARGLLVELVIGSGSVASR